MKRSEDCERVTFDLDIAGHVSTAHPELTWRPDHPAHSVRRTHLYRPRTRARSRYAAVPEYEANRQVGTEYKTQQRLEDLSDIPLPSTRLLTVVDPPGMYDRHLLLAAWLFGRLAPTGVCLR
jgi:hypothetical protein